MRIEKSTRKLDFVDSKRETLSLCLKIYISTIIGPFLGIY